MASRQILDNALKFFLENGYIDRLEAQALIDLVLADGEVHEHEKQFLRDAIHTCNFDEEALKIFQRFMANYERRVAARG